MIPFSFSQVFLCLSFLLLTSGLIAQTVPLPEKSSNNKTIPDTNEVCILPDEFAAFPGGDAGLMKFMQENVRFPKLCIDSGFGGVVYMKFIVERDGHISNIKPLRETKCTDAVEECKRVLKLMPQWRPGLVGEVPVRSECVIPFRFSWR